MIDKDKVEKIVTTKDDNKRLCIITSRFYSSSLDYFLFLTEIAKESFPELRPKDMEIKRYAGRFRKGLFGIEFDVTCENMPDGWRETPDKVILSMFPT